MTPTESADRLLAILDAGSNCDYIGEPISQLEHALQSAARARAAGASDDLVLAALFHDVGHLAAPKDADTLDGFGIADHEAIGADLLASFGCAPTITEPIREHVRAKRYLCARHARYQAKLSEASRETLRRQGGAMTADEMLAYGSRDDLAAILAVRAWDDQAKDPTARVPRLDAYHDLLVDHLTKGAS